MHITPDELFWGNLSGAFEAVDAGTTTILDHAHLNWSPNHSLPAVAGTLSSGIRSIFAYTPTPLLESTSPTVAFAKNPIPDWVMDTMASLSNMAALSDPASRVKLGFGFDFWYLPKAIVTRIMAQARSYGAQVITTHAVKFGVSTGESVIKKAHDYGVLDDGFVFSHAGGSTQEDINLLHAANAFVSATPNTEQAMAVGPSICFRRDLVGADAVCALGVDCHSATNSSIVNEMRLALQSARGAYSIQERNAGNTMPERAFRTTDDAFNLGTIQGARALSMEQDIGSIAVGKKADLVIFDALSPAMLGVAQIDPISAIVLHSSAADIDTVLIDGEYRKKSFKLLDAKAVSWQDGAIQETEETLRWSEISSKILQSQERLLTLISDINIADVESTYRRIFADSY